MASFTLGSATSSKRGWLSLVRVKGHGLDGAVLGTSDVRAGVHWARRSSTPCVGDGCPACLLARPRHYAFLPFAVYTGDRFTRCVLELPLSTALVVQESGKVPGKLFGGHMLQLRRRGGRLRSVIDASFGDECDLSAIRDVEEWEIWRTLSACWGLPVLPDSATNLETWSESMRAIQLARLESLAARSGELDP